MKNLGVNLLIIINGLIAAVFIYWTLRLMVAATRYVESLL